MALDRRFLLRGLFHGTAVSMALPLFDCFLDGNGQALAATGQRIPVRFGTYFWGCGLTKELYLPKSTGQNYDATPQLAVLQPYRQKMNLVSGLKAFSDSKPNYQHWTGVAAINTGVAPAKDREFDVVTLDQTIAESIGKGTVYPGSGLIEVC